MNQPRLPVTQTAYMYIVFNKLNLVTRVVLRSSLICHNDVIDTSICCIDCCSLYYIYFTVHLFIIIFSKNEIYTKE